MGKLQGVKTGNYSDIYGFGKICCYVLFKTVSPLPQHYQQLPDRLNLLIGECLEESPDRRLSDFTIVLDRLIQLREPWQSDDGEFEESVLDTLLMHCPKSLTPPFVGVVVVSGLAMVLTILGMVAILRGGHTVYGRDVQVFIGLSFIYNCWTLFASSQMMIRKSYILSVVGAIFVMACWVWLAFAGVPIGITIIGILAGISVGVFALATLLNPIVRKDFYSPSSSQVWTKSA